VITYSMSSKNAAEMTKLFQQQNSNAPIIGIVKEKWQDLKPHIELAVSGDDGPDGLIEAVRTAINRKQLRRVK
jgi:putative N-acetylmannosamine-6-phosphate epimerase